MIGDKVLRGAIVLVGGMLAKRGIDFATMVLLARLLTPADFGLVALSMTVMLIFMAVSELSVSDALVQMDEPTEEHYQTAWTLGFVRGLAVAAAMVLASFPLSLLYGDARLIPTTCALALPPLLRSCVSPRMARFARTLSFRQEMTVEVGSKAFSFAVAATVALLTGSYWAIIGGQAAAAAAFCAATYVLAPIRPAPTWHAWRDLLGFSVWIGLQRMVNTLNFYADRFLVAGLLGKSDLGHYVLGNDWAALPTQTVQAPLARVIFAGLSTFRQDIDRTRQAYLAGQSACAAALVPVGLGMALVADPFVRLAIGPAWLVAVPIIQVLSPIFAVQALVAPAQAVVMARNVTRLAFGRDAMNLLIRLPLIVAGTFLFGLPGLLAARVLAGLNSAFMSFGMVKRAIGIPIGRQIWSGHRSLGAGVAMCVAVVSAQRWILPPSATASLTVFAASVVGGAAVYIGAHWVLWRLERCPPGPESRAAALASKLFRRVKR